MNGDKHFVSYTQGWMKGWASQAATWGTNLLGMPLHHWNSQGNGASKLRFLQKKEFLLKLATVLAPPSKHPSVLS
jgi:hypothetical protein